jgi:hypothetical protein
MPGNSTTATWIPLRSSPPMKHMKSFRMKKSVNVSSKYSVTSATATGSSIPGTFNGFTASCGIKESRPSRMSI